MEFRKKPVVIEAWPVRQILTAAISNWDDMPAPVRDAYECGGWVFEPTGIHIPTLEGTMKADFDDWIIRGVKGEFYPCKPDIFEATYESVLEL